MNKTSISWTGWTWNCVRGCSRCSEGCRNCYAERIAARFSGPGQAYEGLIRIGKKPTASGAAGSWNGVVRIVPEHLIDPLRRRKGGMVFANSMSDLFHEGLPFEKIAAVYGIMALARHCTFQVLTKRAKRRRQWFQWIKEAVSKVKVQGYSPVAFCVNQAIELLENAGLADEAKRVLKRWDAHKSTAWPLPNVWEGVSVENQAAADERIPELLQTPARVRFLSCEPLIGPVDLQAVRDGSWYDREGAELYDATSGHAYYRNGEHGIGGGPRLDWVIAGAESGPGARPCDDAWLRTLRDQCQAAGVAFFLKQAREQSETAKKAWHPGIRAGRGSRRKSGKIVELPYLDGHQHKEFPRAA